MNCPTCENERLVIADRQGIEIDYCPKCRGVWLDRGELDKLIERAAVAMAPAAVAAPAPPQFQPQPQYQPAPPPQQYPPQQHYGKPPKYDDDYYKKKKRKSFLGEILDF